MKKYLYILLFFTSIVNSQIGITDPTPYSVCESIPNSNVASFYLPYKNYEIFNTLNPDNYTIEYYSDSLLTIPIINSTPYDSSNTTIYIKVIDNSNPEIFEITSLDLIVKLKPNVTIDVTQPTCNNESAVTFTNLPTGTWYLKINDSNSLFSFNTSTHTISNLAPGNYTYQILSSEFCRSEIYQVSIVAPIGVPNINIAPELHQYENPFDGIMNFDLTSQQNNIIGIQTGLSLSYYTSILDAQNNTNQINNPSSFQNTVNPQTIWVRVENVSTNCHQITNFNIKVFDSNTVVYIPDPNFKSRLLSANSSNEIARIQIGGSSNYGNIDSNFDGEIQNTEALIVTELNVNSLSYTNEKISDLTGIEAFVNVSNLNCSYNLLTSLNISSLVNNFFYELNCSNNNLSNFDFNSLGNNLNILNCSGNNITNLNISNLVNLTNLNCSNNLLSDLEITPFHLQKLNCSNNQIASLNFSYPQEMIDLDISNNQMTQLNLSSFSSNLLYLKCQQNIISNLDFSNINPIVLICGPVLSPIQIENCSNLQLLRLYNIQQDEINFNNLVNLVDVALFDTDINMIDMSNARNLAYFKVINAPSLSYINLKCGRTWSGLVGNVYTYPIQISNCSNLNFICSDDQNINRLNQVINYYTSNNQNVNINSYCSFTPGGNYNTITGLVQYDIDQNGCDVLDFPANYTRIDVNLNAVSTNSSVFSNGNGEYNLYTSTTGVYNLVPNIENPSFFNVSPISADVPVMTIDNSVATQNFCITANGVHPDLEIVIAPIVPARPGFTAEYKIVYRNKGNQVMSQLYGVNFFYNQNLMSFVSSTQVPSSIVSGGMSWDFANLLPFESRSINVIMQINAPTDTNPVNIGDVLQFTSSIMPMAGDESTVDNLFQLNQTVVGSFDPNDITCIEGEVVAPSYIGEYLHYVINFENTGTAPAENIVVKIEVNPNDFDINTLRILESSHNATIKITNNILEIIFQTIMLDTGGHGNVLLKMKSKENLVLNDIVTNNAKIYFDYNFPIETNDANTIFQALNNTIPVKDLSISLYPNPASSLIKVRADNNIKSVELYDVQGRIIQVDKVDSNEVSIDVSKYNSGVYFVKVTTEFGSQISKIIKE